MNRKKNFLFFIVSFCAMQNMSASVVRVKDCLDFYREKHCHNKEGLFYFSAVGLLRFPSITAVDQSIQYRKTTLNLLDRREDRKEVEKLLLGAWTVKILEIIGERNFTLFFNRSANTVWLISSRCFDDGMYPTFFIQYLKPREGAYMVEALNLYLSQDHKKRGWGELRLKYIFAIENKDSITIENIDKEIQAIFELNSELDNELDNDVLSSLQAVLNP
jgi:hypothetical protein